MKIYAAFFVDVRMALTNYHGVGWSDVWNWSVVRIVWSTPYAYWNLVCYASIRDGNNAVQSEKTNGL